MAPNAIFFFFYLTAVDVAQHIRDLGFKPQHCLNRSGGGTRVSHVIQATREGGSWQIVISGSSSSRLTYATLDPASGKKCIQIFFI